MSSPLRFHDRRDAGRQLGESVNYLAIERPIVLGLARGGVPVAFEVALTLSSPLDVLVVRKLGVPSHVELAFGAISENESLTLNAELIQRLGLTRRRIARVIERERAELTRRVESYRGGRPALDLVGRAVVIVDDGLATGASARAALDVARTRGAGHIVVAVPVAPRETMTELANLAIELISLQTPPRFRSVGEWYDDFTQTSDEEVASLLHRASSPETGSDR